MKKSLWRVLLVSAACVGLCAALMSVSAADPGPEPVYTVDEPYEYPVQPGTDEWKALTSFQEMIAACHVDEELLASMTTPALLETVLNYPLLGSGLLYDTQEQWIASVSSYFKGLELLLAREDASECLAEFVEIQSTARAELPITIKVNLNGLKKCLGDDSVAPTDASAQRSTTVYLRTPNNSMVEAEYNQSWADIGATEAMAREEEALWESRLSGWTKLADITPLYNCHSYAWHSASTANRYWVPRPSQYMSDGSYTQQSWPLPGYKVHWPIGDHSGIVTTMQGGPYNPLVTSKWGALGLYSHPQNSSPYPGNVTYWNR